MGHPAAGTAATLREGAQAASDESGRDDVQWTSARLTSRASAASPWTGPALACCGAPGCGLTAGPAPDGPQAACCRSRSAAMSRLGGAPKWRLYSRLNWDG